MTMDAQLFAELMRSVAEADERLKGECSPSRVGRVETMARAEQAAQAEPSAGRQQWSDKLRGSDGVMTREP